MIEYNLVVFVLLFKDYNILLKLLKTHLFIQGVPDKTIHQNIFFLYGILKKNKKD